ncbi:MAG TPA: DUF6249 domain-containing protein [Rhizomicrobium sp.]|nr:DUF6249 domain-containing protein [Rhizomicrobium sp.]
MHTVTIGNAITVAASLFAVAGVLIAIIIANQRNKKAKLDFLRGAMERGAALDPELIDKIMRPGAARRQPMPFGKGALVAGIFVVAFSVGYAIFAYFISLIAPPAFFPMIGVAILLACIGIGLFVVSWILRSGHPGE